MNYGDSLKTRRFWLVIFLLWCLAIYNFTEQPVFNGESSLRLFSLLGLSEATTDTIDFIARKLAHAVIFSLLAYFALKVMVNWRWKYPAAWVFSTIFGMVDEWRQLHVYARTGSLRDVVIDSMAALILIIIVYFWEKRSKL